MKRKKRIRRKDGVIQTYWVGCKPKKRRRRMGVFLDTTTGRYFESFPYTQKNTPLGYMRVREINYNPEMKQIDKVNFNVPEESREKFEAALDKKKATPNVTKISIIGPNEKQRLQGLDFAEKEHKRKKRIFKSKTRVDRGGLTLSDRRLIRRGKPL